MARNIPIEVLPGTVESVLAAIPIGRSVSSLWLLLAIGIAWRSSKELHSWWVRRNAGTLLDQMWSSWLERQVPDPLASMTSPNVDLNLVVMDCPHPDLARDINGWPAEWRATIVSTNPKQCERKEWLGLIVGSPAERKGAATNSTGMLGESGLSQ
jgi:hypothetical protein